MNSESTPTASHASETIRRPAGLSALGTLRIWRQVSFAIIMRSGRLSEAFPRVVRRPFDAVRHRKLLTVFVDEVIAHLTSNARYFLQLLPANVAKLPLDVLLLCPAVGHRVLYEGGSDTNAWIADRLQTFLVHQEVAHFARVAGTGEAPKVLCAVVAVDWGLVALLHEAVPVVKCGCFWPARNKLPTLTTICVAGHGG